MTATWPFCKSSSTQLCDPRVVERPIVSLCCSRGERVEACCTVYVGRICCGNEGFASRIVAFTCRRLRRKDCCLFCPQRAHSKPDQAHHEDRVSEPTVKYPKRLQGGFREYQHFEQNLQDRRHIETSVHAFCWQLLSRLAI